MTSRAMQRWLTHLRISHETAKIEVEGDEEGWSVTMEFEPDPEEFAGPIHVVLFASGETADEAALKVHGMLNDFLRPSTFPEPNAE